MHMCMEMGKEYHKTRVYMHKYFKCLMAEMMATARTYVHPCHKLQMHHFVHNDVLFKAKYMVKFMFTLYL